MSTKNYVGFESLEKLLANADSTLPINAMPIVNSQTGKYGISINTQLIWVSQLKPNAEQIDLEIEDAAAKRPK